VLRVLKVAKVFKGTLELMLILEHQVPQVPQVLKV
jgi:hypothetical protein